MAYTPATFEEIFIVSACYSLFFDTFTFYTIEEAEEFFNTFEPAKTWEEDFEFIELFGNCFINGELMEQIHYASKEWE